MTEDEFTTAVEDLGLTPNQIAELRTDQERAAGWIDATLRATGLNSPVGFLLSKFRSGLSAPTPYVAGRKKQLTYEQLLAKAERLVVACGHEYRDTDMRDEVRDVFRWSPFDLQERDERRLMADAAIRRATWEAQQDQSRRRTSTMSPLNRAKS